MKGKEEIERRSPGVVNRLVCDIQIGNRPALYHCKTFSNS